ncbi:MAG: hypothetical protein JHD16_00460 [Solirubrobacteraceae bacterium]|nr:hypothetical protein [Solirubrobacteraceae bacterium]
MPEITVGMCVALDPDGRYGLFEDGGRAPHGGTIEHIYESGEVLVRFYDGEGWVEWSMPARAVRRIPPPCGTCDGSGRWCDDCGEGSCDAAVPCPSCSAATTPEAKP